MLTEKRIAELLRASSFDYQQAETAHHRLDEQIAGLYKRHVLTPQEELRVKQMQKEKLATKDQMASLIRTYREQQAHAQSH
ncbi:MAG: YdcH family protein [Nitrospira sp.]|nr:DUF465 domain-containing protein [Nitrospira sp.]